MEKKSYFNGVDKTRIGPDRITDRTTDRIADRITDQITEKNIKK